jgi:hypothetical protein
VQPTKVIPFPSSKALEPLEGAVTFHLPFMLPGLAEPHPPGTFLLQERREALDVSWPAFVVSLSVLLVDGGTTQSLDVSRHDLEAAMARDRAGRTH